MSETPSRKPSLWRTAKAVAWSFIGLRAGSDYEEDVKNLSPLHIIAVGLLLFEDFLLLENSDGAFPALKAVEAREVLAGEVVQQDGRFVV